MEKRLNIVIVDDDRSSTYCLNMKLNKMKQVARVDLAMSAKELLEKYMPARHYDIVYLDQLMPGMDGTEAVEIIKEKYPDTSIVFHTATNDMDVVKKIFKTKPKGWLWKDFMCHDAELSVETIASGHHFYSKEAEELRENIIEEKISDENKPDGSKKLSQRKTEVLKHFCRGLTYKEIGNTLCIEERTVETHMKDIHSDTGLKSRAELVEFSMAQGIIPKF